MLYNKQLLSSTTQMSVTGILCFDPVEQFCNKSPNSLDGTREQSCLQRFLTRAELDMWVSKKLLELLTASGSFSRGPVAPHFTHLPSSLTSTPLCPTAFLSGSACSGLLPSRSLCTWGQCLVLPRSSWHVCVRGPQRGGGRAAVLPICLSRSAASSGVARGRTPGSLKLVRSRVPITKKNRTPPTAGMAGVMLTARYGQLWTGGGEKGDATLGGNCSGLGVSSSSWLGADCH